VKELKKTMLFDIKRIMKLSPVIVFLEKEDLEFRKELLKLCEATETTFLNPKDSKSAL
jgi:hypothetical protein